MQVNEQKKHEIDLIFFIAEFRNYKSPFIKLYINIIWEHFEIFGYVP